MTAASVWLMGGASLPGKGPYVEEAERDLWLYRDRTVSILKRIARSSV